MAQGTVTKFANHRGVVPMLWAMVMLAGCELVGVHLLLSLWSHRAAWAMSVLTLLSMVWLIRWVTSWKRLPHELLSDHLRLHMGSVRSIDIPLDMIADVRADVSAELLKAPGTRNLVPMAHPNRLIELRAPMADRRGTRRIAVRFDDAASFDAALRGMSIQA
ncbi:hypothetical protein HNO88_002419 [Novosphingobium chloroacetimidivorans]|uniref:Uncharacterized protein n=1 Tax=Novosphingobium chloroacetimidivorans TaxID=1428314 RepID=A0A7W7KBF3_9SPHN|nr:hypothetical protein [Novosphingobium chloroacetimidivorans]MBB4859093.1 hypothetical protein [Novosphingobium chloroacetimidivorans]